MERTGRSKSSPWSRDGSTIGGLSCDQAARRQRRRLRREPRSRSFRSNAVLRWEYRPGSTIFLVWSQTRYGEFTGVNAGLVGDLRQATFLDRPTNVLQVKVNYWLRP
jgi:hypothetical protein